jgi:FtsP/CotA-like multicopper oxidase with cupredoxin domain
VPRRQRLLFALIAVVIAVVAVALLVGTGDNTQTADTPTPTATATEAQQAEPGAPTATPSATATPAPTPVVDGTGAITRIEVTEGERVRFAVRASSPQEVHVHGYDILRDAAPGKPARFSFTADITGRFEVEYEGAGRQVAELEVQPK